MVPALSTRHRRFDSTPPSNARPLSFALFAVLRFVEESLVPIELLFARREHELRTAIHTNYISVRKELHRPSLTLKQIHKVKGGRSRRVNLAA